MDEPNFARGRHKARKPLVRISATSNEQTITSAFGFPNADGYVFPYGDAAALGATVRLYAITDESRTLEATAVIADVTKAIRVSAAGRGCDSWDLTIQTLAAAPLQSKNWSVQLVTFEGSATTASVVPSTGTTPGAPTWDHTNAPSKIVKNGAGQLLAAFGRFASGGAGTRWLMFFDANAVPANGTAPLLPSIPFTGVDVTFAFDLTNASDPPSAPGRSFTTGLVWAISSAQATLLVDAASTFDVETKVL